MRTKREFLTRLINSSNEIVSEKESNTIEEATKGKIHDNQVTFEDAERDRVKYNKSYTHVMEFRDNEHYNDMYFN